MGNNAQGSRNNESSSISLLKPERSNMAGYKGVPAHYQERSTKAGNHKLEVAVRIPSFHHPKAPSPRGAIYEVDPTKSTNKLYNLACNEGANMAALADFQSVEFPRAEGTLPLVGLPIGAGPEGAPGLSHVGSFEDCVLHTRNLIACMGDGPTCLLAAKSKSFCCLHALKAGEEGPGQQLQQALPARERTQSVGSSAEFSDYEDSGAEEDQLF
ncbi:hypothetical protein UCDDA912_g05917 [Diaporthe ampelina]|uniref:Uncharacterized protein n=1 Tax=Diaporthe ampelina TaxID=1214573 RepID=A0A0G2FJ69_9PEZI|nr:hypothetical protein UCDDA912_g05917 [Diaporthe ampelina]